MDTVSVNVDGYGEVAVPAGTSAELVLEQANIEAASRPKKNAFPPLAVLINNELAPLSAPIGAPCSIKPVYPDSPMGTEVYRRSLCFILALAAREIVPSRRLTVSMAIGNGYYHYFDDNEPVSAQLLEALSRRMRELVLSDLPIRIVTRAWEEALEYFKTSNQSDTLALMEYINDPFIQMNECNGFRDFHIAPLVPRTGLLSVWELVPYRRGMLLRFPHTKTPYEMDPFSDVPVLYDIAEEYEHKARILNAESVGALNRINQSGNIQDFILVAEALQNKKLALIADRIAEKSDKTKVVLIAGPSSSGKTTTAKKLAIQLKVLGFRPIHIELDNYFVDRSRTPLDKDGKPDFECLEALDIEYLNQQLLDLFDGKEVELPLYDFKSGTRKASGRKISLSNNEILILEGIHGLNDRLTPHIPAENKLKIYVSALTQLNIDDHNRVRTTDYRLLRRMVRDYNFRGHSAQATLGMWSSVQRGERLYIFPFQGSADIAFNSALDYELGVLKVFAEPLLQAVKPQHDEYPDARRIQAFISRISPISPQYVPSDSILREFIGGSVFKY
ncbi:AAA ATPase [uncultured spirochete]|jgi:uridine kinase|uniref:AAA ATPase n=1 Tax=uncultured spirochete TaxID=156406 RepID=A0A3P3XLH6_9SPIR|nr:nucleoside kinase [Rectinema subterraneum]SLM15537.1 AAA ATPase [uncultured spirochete]